jgi:glycosyltransferase 2 family protein
MPKLLRNGLKFLVFLAIGLFFVWLSVRDFTPEQKSDIIHYIASANYWLLIPVVIVGILSNIVRAARWRLLIHPLKYNPGLFNTFCAVMVGYLTNLAIPRAGEISRCGVLARYEKIPADKLIGTMIAERSVDIFTLLFLLLLSVTIQLEVLGDYFFTDFVDKIKDKMSHLTGFHIIIPLLLFIILITIVSFLLKNFSHTKVYRRMRILIKRIWKGFLSIGRMKDNGWFIFYTILLWSLYLIMVWIGFYCLKATSSLGIKAALAVLAFGSVGMTIPTQGGIGSYQIIVEKVLTLFQIPARIGAALSWILWIVQMGMFLIVGFVCLILLSIINKSSNGKSVPAKN